ncbi:hypothetical protein K491DRAFT_714609 [Lophiostoma macrostomum CBS 122681]|uniref:Uncharacterized protein n=1 Tax=Lophiostoma macrostomum CBS 122681 TaxID=1314788 RepID=A0A6A6TD01_9PLEO|nr:hypothetical protein K491DRAFT_714609 [Lophiostoma macrostomum CBS 122681]
MANALILVRAIDGIPHEKDSVRSLCLLAERNHVQLFFLFQMNKVFDAIRPQRLIAVRGLGSIADVVAKTLLSYLRKEGDRDPQATSLFAIWKSLTETKRGDGEERTRGIQDRNMLPLVGTLGAQESSKTSSYNRRGRTSESLFGRR